MNKLRIVVSLPNDNAYQHEQGASANSAAKQLGLTLQVIRADDDSITQSQQLLKLIQSPPDERPNAILVEPVAAGIAWVISNNDVDYIYQLRKTPQVPVFTVTQGQQEIGRLQGKQLAALLPQGGSILCIEGPSMSSVAVQRREGMETTKPRSVQATILRSKWSEDSANQSAASWLRLATSRAEKFDVVAGQTHELALGARKALQNSDNPDQQKKWLEVPFLGIGIASQVKPLVDSRVLTAAVITSVTMDLALRTLVQALEKQSQPPERTVVEASSYPALDRLSPKR